ncbi:hypothetical protein [Cyanobacterium sp. Dongsha4]|nr:hypothetical protein [Cyanobacterium sp. Dongsha4]WVL01878.1 hypothetical protein Dongsha4_06740 [Cyanobacterium sp. Dongsha4]
MIRNTLIFMSISLSSPKIRFMHNHEKKLRKILLNNDAIVNNKNETM